jgi:hypothetical protein
LNKDLLWVLWEQWRGDYPLQKLLFFLKFFIVEYLCLRFSSFFPKQRYKLIKEVGDGTFGSVWRAINKQSSEVVSILQLELYWCSVRSWIMCFILICQKITGCDQENEKEILLLGGVCKPERSQGITSHFSFLNLFYMFILLHIFII